MKFKDGDMALLTYDASREADLGPRTLVKVNGLDTWLMDHHGAWSLERIGHEPAYEVEVLDPLPKGYPKDWWCWEHELRRVTRCPMT